MLKITWHHRAVLDYLQQVWLTAYSDQLLGVCQWLRAQHLLDLLENRDKYERALGLAFKNAKKVFFKLVSVLCSSAHLCMIHHCLSQSLPQPRAGWQSQASAPVQTLTAFSKTVTVIKYIKHIKIFEYIIIMFTEED